MLTLWCPDEAATEGLGARLWQAARAAATEQEGLPSAAAPGPPIIVLLRGPLAAGKTTLVRGALHAAGLAGAVRSPTFTLVEVYSLSGSTIYHWDLYRLADGASLDALGFRDYLHPGAVLFIEWPERSPALFEQHAVEVRLSTDGDGRTVTIAAGPCESGRLLPGLMASVAEASTQ